MKARSQTPCRGICSTGIGDTVCRGCKRYAHEVIAWNGYTPEQRGSVMDRLEQFTVRVMAARCEVVDAELLLKKVREHSIRVDESADPYCWLYELLRAGRGQIRNPAVFGFRILTGYRSVSLAELFADAEKALFVLSEAHYERYVAPRGFAAEGAGP